MPDTPTQELRTLLRTRKQLVRERSSHTLRLQKTLEDANIKLDCVISDIVGLSGRRMIEAVISGETNPAVLAELAHRRLRASPEQLCDALRGRVTRHHRFMLALHLRQIDAVEGAIAQVDQEVDEGLAPFRGSIPEESELFASPIPTAAGTPKRQEGPLRRRRLHAHCRLSHAQRRHPLPGPRRRPLR